MVGLRSTLRTQGTLRRAPARSFFICGTPRSGTTLLAALLASTGRVGLAREYFSRANEPDWAASDYGAFVAHTVRRTSRGRVFGAKLLQSQLGDFLARLRTVPRWQGLSDLALLESAFPRPSFVWICRRDVVAQAVSFVKAEQTGEFYAGKGGRPGARPVFDFEAIRCFMGKLTEANERWREWFAAYEIEPFSIDYEELTADSIGASRRVLGFLGVELPRDAKIVTWTVKQADAVNDQWIARYRAMADGRTDG
jgi:LPS sulfotransferase NodH